MDLLLFVLLLVSVVLAPMAKASAPEDRIDFDLATEMHDDLYRKLDTYLRQTSNPPYEPREVEGRAVLAGRRPNMYDEPPRWIMVHVRFGEAETTLAIAQDDLYLIGFNNSAGNWYELEGKKPGKGFSGLPGSAVLPIKQNYADLLGRADCPADAHMFLSTVPLGNLSAIQAVKALAGYNLDKPNDDELGLEAALVRFVVMISEAMRFSAIREKISGEQWKQETFIAQREASYVIYWANLSHLLIRWKQKGYWGGDSSKSEGWLSSWTTLLREEIGVKDETDALAIVDFLIRPKPTTGRRGGRKLLLDCYII
ncbi:hypothetical protein HU200_030024 [Digitaria exilis]|uniref:rRNA N-glycosylase n=1 Tax=Digitaria exilis TaxID=1010633 RepID=A0A835BPB9_9POAL|nr:hypothetical protein HU200_030024 [Digitaria exilis]